MISGLPGGIAQLGERGASATRLAVLGYCPKSFRDPLENLFDFCDLFFVISGLPGAIAQLGERYVRNVEVSGSIPLSSTKIN